MQDLNFKLNKLYARHYNYQIQADLYNDRSQDDFDEGRGNSSVAYDKKYLMKVKQLEKLEKEIDQLKKRIDKGCKIVDSLVLKQSDDLSYNTSLIVEFSKRFKNKKYSIHEFLTKDKQTNNQIVVLVANTNSLSRIKVEELFKTKELPFNKKSWDDVFPNEDED